MDCVLFKETTIPSSWFRLVYELMKGDVPRSIYRIEKGSYVGSQRLEFDHVTIQIDHPGSRPLIPEIPPGLTIPPPVESMDYVEEYFANYLMNPELETNETYRYSTWLVPGVERVIEQLRDSHGNNQAAISIGGWAKSHERWCCDDNIDPKTCECEIVCIDTDNVIDPATNQRDPACLRICDFRLDQSRTLHMVVYFRSWDLFNGYPANLAGLQLLKEYVAQEIDAQDGRLIASSKGLHLYSHAISVAAERVGMTGVSTMEDFLAAVGETL